MHAKYGGGKNPTTENGRAGRNLQETASIVLEDIANMQYFGPVYFGVSEEPVTMLFDTGSPDIWLYSYEDCQVSKQCPSDGRTMFHKEHRSAHYSEDDSEDNRLSLQYALGRVTGSYVAEKLCFA